MLWIINKTFFGLILCYKCLITGKIKQYKKTTLDVVRLSCDLHQLFQAGEVDAVYAVDRGRSDVLLDVSSVHKCQVNLFCHV